MSPDKRRPQGTGSLSQRSDGLWVGRVDAGWTAQGTRRRLTVSSKSKAEAARKLRELLRRINAGEVAASGAGARVTVKSWADTWLPLHAAKVRPTTYTTDRGAVRKWIIPTIGHRRLADLTPADLRALRQAIVTAGRSTTTALHAHKILVKMLKDARQEGHAVPDRVLEAPKPAKARNDRGAMPVSQALRVLAVVSQRDDSARWVCALLYGMRQGEALGLTWDRVDFDAGRIDLTWQLQHLSTGHNLPDGWEERPIEGRAYWTRPKTMAGERILPMPRVILEVFLAAKHQWRENPHGLVWADDKGAPIKAADDRARWHAIQAEAGVSHPSGRPWHVHECRHAAATILDRLGTPHHVIEAILGHTALVRSYLHHDMDDMLKALEGAAEQLQLDDLTRRLVQP